VSNILITGAAGYIGQHLTRELSDEGHTVLPTDKRGLPTILDILNFDSNLLNGIDVVIHTAALVHKPSATSDEYFKINVEGTLNLARACVQQKVKHLIFFSTIGVHGNHSTESTCENSPLNPQTPYAKSKLQAEEKLRVFAKSEGLGVTILRPTMVYGPDAPGNVERLRKIIALGVPLPFALLHNQRSFLHIKNLAGAISAIISRNAVPNETYVISDFQSGTPGDLARYIAKTAGKNVRLLPVPKNLLVNVLKLLRRHEMISQLCESLVVDNRRIHHEIGWQPSMKAFETK
jgi:nucleoside-diphosphate-sugar epimerase